MNKSTIEIGRLLSAILLIMIFATACGSKLSSALVPSQTPIPATITQNLPTTTPILLASTPTPSPALQPYDYLLTEDELPVDLYMSFMHAFLQTDGSILYGFTFFNPDVGRMNNSITVAAQPYDQLPGQYIVASTGMEDPLIGENSLAYIDNGQLTYLFFKGNALIQLSGYLSDSEIAKRGDLTLEEFINLGKVIEARLPDAITFLPITCTSVGRLSSFPPPTQKVFVVICFFPQTNLLENLATLALVHLSL